MKILIVGGGGRESALVTALLKSPKTERVAVVPGNAGISALGAFCYNEVKATDFEGVLKVAKDFKAEFIIVAPDDPLVLGLVDFLENQGFKTFGPRKNAAIIEGSKSFSKELMRRYDIPTAKYEVFTDSEAAIEYLKSIIPPVYPVVIKADGLALGKGVIIAESYAEAENAVCDCLDGGKFGESGDKIVIEEYLTGPEVTVLCLTDGKDFIALPASTDHKRVFDGDKGLNTGGMGVIAPAPYYTEEIEKETIANIIKPTIAAMKMEGRIFKGCLYFGLMLTPNGTKVIEYNCRFGDPETQTILPLLSDELDFAELLQAVRDENLGEFIGEYIKRGNPIFKDKSAVTVVLASGGYPEKYETGFEITGIDEIPTENSDFYYSFAGVNLKDGKPVTSGGRVLAVTALGENLISAREKAYQETNKISFSQIHFRKDIGYKAIEYINGQ